MILIIPGFFRKKEFYAPLSDQLKKEGFTVETVDLKRNTRGLKSASETAMQCFEKAYEKCDVIAHSFGGIIVKYLLCNNPEIKNKISSITFVSVPHGGSWQALLLSIFPTARQLLPFRKELKKLACTELPQETVNFIAETELKVWPRKGGLLKEHIDIVIPDTNHDSIMNSDNFIKKAILFIKSRHDRIFLE